MKINRLIVIFLLYAINSYTQHSRIFTDSENKLKIWFDSLFKRNEVKYLLPDSLKILYSDSIFNELSYILKQNNAFTYKFKTIKNIGDITSADSLVRIITWNIKLKNNHFLYYGFILYRENITDERSKVFELIDKSDSLDEQNNIENEILNHKKWYGATYYQIGLYTHKGRKYYLLIGWDGYSAYTNRKIVEVLTFTQKGKPIFGKTNFISPEKNTRRLIFTHSIKASMSCIYDDKKKAIIFDHLVPSSPIYKNMYEFYGPNGTYDAYFLKGNTWIFKEDIETKNPPPKN
jgi:hypothetical protein